MDRIFSLKDLRLRLIEDFFFFMFCSDLGKVPVASSSSSFDGAEEDEVVVVLVVGIGVQLRVRRGCRLRVVLRRQRPHCRL